MAQDDREGFDGVSKKPVTLFIDHLSGLAQGCVFCVFQGCEHVGADEFVGLGFAVYFPADDAAEAVLAPFCLGCDFDGEALIFGGFQGGGSAFAATAKQAFKE